MFVVDQECKVDVWMRLFLVRACDSVNGRLQILCTGAKPFI